MILGNARIWIDGKLIEGNVVIDEDKSIITKLTKEEPIQTPQFGEYIDLKKKVVIPSLVDIHTHLRDFTEAHKETYVSGAMAAATGGFSHIFDMPNKKPPVISKQNLSKIRNITKDIFQVEIIPFIMLNNDTEIPFAYEYPYLKAYMGHTTGSYISTPEIIKNFFRNSSSFLSVHCEDDKLIQVNEKKMIELSRFHCEIRNPKTEINSISTLLRMYHSLPTQIQLHIAHTTLLKSIKMLNKAKISFEVTPHHLLLNSEDYSVLGVWAKMNPPLREKNEQRKLLAAFKQGNIPIIASDHAPHTIMEKENEQVSGIPGLETTVPLLLNSLQPLDIKKLNLIINSLAINPRNLMNLKLSGKIKEGEVADLTVIDPKLIKTVRGDNLETKCKWTPWEGVELKGWPVLTIHNGRITFNAL